MDLGIEQGTLSFYRRTPYVYANKIIRTKKKIKSIKAKIRKLRNWPEELQ